ncbi:MAG: non-canonical purine NTP pyrophosphatase [Candidatus Kerfeldbacteria bacterium]|nr:non-canonical purine NTP pyrophosphatase [Candidatus Kerfeldbacteria bacterium]
MEKRPVNILLCTDNEGKIAEIRARWNVAGTKIWSIEEINSAFGLSLTAPNVVEDGHTLEENAWLKTEGWYKQLGPVLGQVFGGEIAFLAEDSGLFVYALPGKLGVFSKRFAPKEMQETMGVAQANNTQLLQLLTAVPTARRTGHYAAALCLVDISGEILFETTGELKVTIVTEARGSLGFGYDPLTVPNGQAKTFGEMTTEEKNSLGTHRTRALDQLVAWLQTQVA